LVLAVWIRPDSGLAQTSDNQVPGGPPATPAALAGSSFPWPHQFSEAGQAFTVYPPQLNKWQGERLEGQAAVAVQPAGADKPVFGVVWLSARTELDPASGMVKVRDISASRASFPTAAAQAGAYLDAIRAHLATMSWSVARERLESDLAIEHASREVQNQPLRNIAPRILYSETPAILVPIDGAPQLKEMSGLELMRVINTRALILQDKTTGRYFLYVAGHWMEAAAIEGPWSEAHVRPSALDEAKQQALASGQVELVEDSEAPSARAPSVYVSTGPAELVQTDGPPQYLPIQGTNLLYVTNTPNRLFLDLQTQRYYLLLAGRWYRTASLSQGSWEFVPGTSLPADFAMIPDNHPSEGVRAAVPGTAQAQEAVIENSVPQVAAVKRSAATLEITYDGSPQFRPIEGTALQYAVNAPIPVIEVDPSAYYALDNGVWFVSNSAFGAWSAATWVPPVIYSIPRSSPLHYVTYVRVYEATPEVVYEGYYPGYVGSYVAPDTTVVYGTGWYYQPWIGTVWYGAPVTWGFGFSFYSSWWGPWPYQPWFWAGWAPYPFFRPWWGPWCAPVAIAPAFVPHRVFVGHGVAPVGVGRVTVNSIHANTVNVTNIFNRWGNRVATPLGPRATFASTGNGMRPTGPGAMQGMRGGAPMARGPGNESMAFAGGAAPHSSVTGAAGAAMGGATRTTPASPSGGNPNLQGFRRSGGQWQSFAGNGQWRNVNAPNLNSQSPPFGQGGSPRPGTIGGAPVVSGAPGGAPRPGTIGGAPVTSGAPAHGWSGPGAGQSMAPSAPQRAMGGQGNRWSGSSAPRSMAWTGPGRSFVPSDSPHFGQGGGAAPIGRSGGAWAPAHGGATAGMAGGNAVGGRPAIGGGGGHGWGGAGGGGRMGGSMR
jgi:hypothetical protein